MGLTINSASLSASTLADYTIGSQNTSEKEVDKEEGRYNRNFRVYCDGMLSNIILLLNRTLCFATDVINSTIRPITVKILAVALLQHILTPLFTTVDVFSLVIP